jgi:glycosyltransferase involved in cell wall biosynthesis
MQPIYSLIVPLYNEQDTLPELVRRLTDVMNSLDAPTELVLINDGSKDQSLMLLRSFHQQDDRICYINLARNFGHQIAVTAGLNFVRGDMAIILDADLQDPPELIPELIKQWRSGFQVVYAQRTKRIEESWGKRFLAYWFYRILRQLADVEIPTDTGDFCLIDRSVIDILNSMPERTRYLRGLRSWVGFNQTFRKSFKLAMNGIVSFSQVPLRLSTYIGLFAAIVSLLMALLILYWRIFVPHSPLTGFTMILVAVFFLGAVQLVCIGILGEYIGRIYEEVKGRPLYTISEIVGLRKP